MAKKPQQRIDLTDKKALVAAFKKHHNEMWKAFGTAPQYKDYDPNKLMAWIDDVIKKEGAHISDHKKKEIFDIIKQKGSNVKLAMQYIVNLFLKGAGLGLNENQEKLLRKVIREEIKRILTLKEKVEYAEEQWNDEPDSQEEKKKFLKSKYNKFQGASFRELPSSIQNAWRKYIHS